MAVMGEQGKVRCLVVNTSAAKAAAVLGLSATYLTPYSSKVVPTVPSDSVEDAVEVKRRAGMMGETSALGFLCVTQSRHAWVIRKPPIAPYPKQKPAAQRGHRGLPSPQISLISNQG